VELAEVFAVEARPQICDENLGAFEESYSFSVEAYLVAEAGKVFGYQVDQACSGVVGVVDAVNKAAFELLGIDQQRTRRKG